MLSQGCLRCRTRRVKCDAGRPSCRRCIQRNEICVGYRDVASLMFRSENEKAARKKPRRVASQSALNLDRPSQAPGISRTFRECSSTYSRFDLSRSESSDWNFYEPKPWLKAVPNSLPSSIEDQAVSQFFEKYVMYPCNHNSSPGFLEHLPSLFKEVEEDGKMALRWAVRAAAYAGISKDHGNVKLYCKALSCYGLALSGLKQTLEDSRQEPDDFILMTVVVLDLFETCYLQDSVSLGSHAEGMAQILRLRGPNQIDNIRGWSLFRLSHHRLQMQQLIAKQDLLPESETWLESLNDQLPDVKIEKHSFEINKICERARKLLNCIDNTEVSSGEMLEIIEEMHELDRIAVTWRHGPAWAYRTLDCSEIAQDTTAASNYPGFVQLHQDIWIAYEWNYHRAARIILHEHLIKCINQVKVLPTEYYKKLPSLMDSLRKSSEIIIKTLVDEVLSTVPQSLGDIDHEGKRMDASLTPPICKGVAGYFLLWPIKISKSTVSATAEQRSAAQSVFERIRECTGMKRILGEASSI